jgi:hypothetical protein
VLQSNVAARRRFQLVLIKPSHYDDDGYVIRWWRAMTPSNSLAAVYGIAADCAERRVLGPDVDIDIEVIDETNTRIDIPALLSRYRRHGDFGCVALIKFGVRSAMPSITAKRQCPELIFVKPRLRGLQGPPPPRPPRRSIASVSFIPIERSGFPVSVLATGHFWRRNGAVGFFAHQFRQRRRQLSIGVQIWV